MAVKVNQWWEVNSILLTVEPSTEFVLYKEPEDKDRYVNGVCNSGSIQLTRAEAQGLVCELNRAIGEYDRLEKQCEQYMRKSRLKNKRGR